MFLDDKAIMTIDISMLSVNELEDLISRAAERRASMQPEYSKNLPTGLVVAAINDPIWVTAPISESNGNIGLHIRHLGYGWLSFVIPPPEIAKLMGFWASALAAAAASGSGQSIAAEPVSGGGTFH